MTAELTFVVEMMIGATCGVILASPIVYFIYGGRLEGLRHVVWYLWNRLVRRDRTVRWGDY